MERIERAILLIRGEKVMLDLDLAVIYEVSTGALNQAVKRNLGRFPPDFMFQLTQKEKAEVITNCDNLARLKFSPHVPYAFTEHGALMLANVLNSERAAQTSVQVVRAFVKLRQMLASNADLARKLAALEQKYDAQFKVVFDAIRQLMSPPAKPKREIGFHVKYDDDKPKARRRCPARLKFNTNERSNPQRLSARFQRTTRS
ncbi:MAG: ORF6N domain-containing protein [Limisphaerales bacterium]